MRDILRLGVNIDHVATVRNARGGIHPDPIRAAKIVQKAGADGITAHLREDRRHIKDRDIELLREEIDLPLNLEMASTNEMLDIALKVLPNAVCLVPEKREERTTEGGLDIAGNIQKLEPFVRQLNNAGIRLSLFIEPDRNQLDASKALGVPVVELHTGAYCLEKVGSTEQSNALAKIIDSASYAEKLGIECHAGHGLDFSTVKKIAAIPNIVELNIGHFLIGEAIFEGLEQSISRMRALIENARSKVLKD
ncbi:MAG: pyridoxine 5'-phosphate synthase [Pseudomonadota bacterium]|nr:pyridoxine 5'-phosphate synthase [Pseudomonadota bacterium]